MFSNSGGFDPWDTLRRLPNVRVSWVDIPDGSRGRTDGLATIWLHRGQQQAERRCGLTHELVHLHEEHVGCQPARIEWAVRVRTARLLINTDQLTRALLWTPHVSELAEELWVTTDVVRDRLASITDSERHHILRCAPYAAI